MDQTSTNIIEGHHHQHQQQTSTATATSVTTVPMNSVELCLVCGDRASGRHYGAISCEGCKGFFKRSIRKQLGYQCRGTMNCEVTKHHRNRCQFCRLQKCLASGMRSDSVQHERKPIVDRKDGQLVGTAAAGSEIVGGTTASSTTSSASSSSAIAPGVGVGVSGATATTGSHHAQSNSMAGYFPSHHHHQTLTQRQQQQLQQAAKLYGKNAVCVSEQTISPTVTAAPPPPPTGFPVAFDISELHQTINKRAALLAASKQQQQHSSDHYLAFNDSDSSLENNALSVGAPILTTASNIPTSNNANNSSNKNDMNGDQTSNSMLSAIKNYKVAAAAAAAAVKQKKDIIASKLSADIKKISCNSESKNSELLKHNLCHRAIKQAVCALTEITKQYQQQQSYTDINTTDGSSTGPLLVGEKPLQRNEQQKIKIKNEPIDPNDEQYQQTQKTFITTDETKNNKNVDDSTDQLIPQANVAFSVPAPAIVPTYLYLHYVCECAARIFFHTNEWLRKLPIFARLPSEIRLRLLQRNWPPLFVLGFAQSAVKISIPVVITTLITNVARLAVVRGGPRLKSKTTKRATAEASIVAGGVGHQHDEDDGADDQADDGEDSSLIALCQFTAANAKRIEHLTESIATIDDFLRCCQQLNFGDSEFALLRLIVIFAADGIIFERDNCERKTQIEMLQRRALRNVTVLLRQKKRCDNDGDDVLQRILCKIGQLRSLQSDDIEELFFAALVGPLRIDNTIDYMIKISE